MQPEKKIFSTVSEKDVTKAIVEEFSREISSHVESDCIIVGAGSIALMAGKEKLY